MKRLNNNFLDNLEHTNLLLASNKLNHGELTKKRNKSSTKSYNNKDNLDNSDISYSANVVKKGLMN